jgi:lipid-binding SYLF domain-containing protein
MNQKGMERLAGDKFTIGGDASAAIGPLGRTAAGETDARLTPEMLSYSRTRGLFAGVSLDGSTIAPDHSEDRKIYGQAVKNHAIIRGEVKIPGSRECPHFGVEPGFGTIEGRRKPESWRPSAKRRRRESTLGDSLNTSSRE